MRLVMLGIVGICFVLLSIGLRAAEDPSAAAPVQDAQPAESAPPATQPAATRPAAATQPATTAPATTRPSNEVVIETSMGAITIELTPDRTPITVENFLQYVDDEHYDGTIFHRVMTGFMIQGGGYTPDLEKKDTRAPVRNESRDALRNTRGTIAMALMPGDPDSATTEFYINHVDNPALNHGGPHGGYAVFGRVVDGMDVVDRIASVPIMQRPPRFTHLPRQPVEIRTIRRK